MKKTIRLLALGLGLGAAAFWLGWLTGCAKPQPVTAYGASGKNYQAPSICAAIQACQQAGEKSCSYDRTEWSTAQGIQTETCVNVTTK